jgi:antirestriction protein ArdC
MKFTGKAEDIAIKLVDLFKNGDPGKAMSNVFVKCGTRHIDNWSFNNQLIAIMSGYTDAMGFNQWISKDRKVKKGERAMYILAPLTCKAKKKENGIEKEYTFIRGFRGLPVFGYEQTEGKPIEYQDNALIDSLPLLEVAKAWGIQVGTYKGRDKAPQGYFSPDNMKIMLGVENLSTWLHELIHDSEKMLGVDFSDYAKNRADYEIVAELGSTVLAHCLGLHEKADNGGCWDYIQSWAKKHGKEPSEACFKLIDRTCKAVNNILTSQTELVTA